jgi:hypothetical protein
MTAGTREPVLSVRGLVVDYLGRPRQPGLVQNVGSR